MPSIAKVMVMAVMVVVVVVVVVEAEVDEEEGMKAEEVEKEEEEDVEEEVVVVKAYKKHLQWLLDCTYGKHVLIWYSDEIWAITMLEIYDAIFT